MKSTFIKVVFSVLIILAFLVGMSKLYDFGLAQNVNMKASYVQSTVIDADVLLHGPCEPLWMIYPKLLDQKTGVKSYNLALSHSDFADNFLHLYLYLKNNKAPKYLFLYATSESMDGKYNTFHTYRFAPYVGDPVVDSVLKENDSAYFMWTKIPFMKYAYYSNSINFETVQGLKHYIVGKTDPRFPDGYEPPYQRLWDNHFDAFIKLYPNGYRFKWSKLRERYLRKILVLANQHNIEVVLYESPVLNEAIPYQPNRKAITDSIRMVAQEYGAEYVQFQDMEMANHRKYYTSALNTTIAGARVFTDSLGLYIKGRLAEE